MNKRNVIRIISFLSAAILVLGGVSIKYAQKSDDYKIQLENTYSRSLNDFGAAIDNISATLEKARFITSPEQLSSTAAKLLTQAEISKSALANLPSAWELETLNRFLSQVGNYAMSVSKNAVNGQSLSKQDADNIESLSNTAKKISSLIQETQITHNNADYWALELDKKVKETADITSLADSLGELDEQLSDLPSLIYDGPYSDHILEKEPEMLKNTAEVTEAEALYVAAQTALCEVNELTPNGTIEGSIPSFRFKGENLTVAVSKMGGYAVFMRKETETGNNNLSYEQARAKAVRYLNQLGKKSFKETYYFTSEGVCVINFAFVDGKTVCYTDLIKVGVDMDSGDIVLYEAGGYISNHKNRAFKTPIHTLEEAEAVVSKNLTVTSTALALIPTESTQEVRCYEFACKAEDETEVLVYINTSTLAEEEILILLKTDGGTLVK